MSESPVSGTIRMIRGKLDLTQEQFADKLGVSSVYVSNLETGSKRPSMNLINKIRDVTGHDVYVLAWIRHGDISKLPVSVQNAARKLTEAMNRHLCNKE
jgi:transcriptional regulator with XRE-family HTH domain